MNCVGDDRAYSFLPSRLGGTLPDRVARLVLSHRHPEFVSYPFLERGSDERQYCAPGVDLPVCSIMRSKYGTYPEYHTSLDDLSLITSSGLQGAYEVMKDCLELIEHNRVYRTTVLCEPQLGRRGLYPTIGTGAINAKALYGRDLLAYADGTKDLIDLCFVIKVAPWELYPIIDTLKGHDLIKS